MSNRTSTSRVTKRPPRPAVRPPGTHREAASIFQRAEQILRLEPEPPLSPVCLDVFHKALLQAEARPRFAKLPEVADLLAEKATRLYERVKLRTLTPPVKLTLRSSAWPEHEVQALVRAQMAGCSDLELTALVQRLVAARTQFLPCAAATA